MALISCQLADHLCDHYGYVSLAELDSFEVTPARRKALVAAGLLEVFLPGVYRWRSTPDSLQGRSLGVCLAHPTAVVTGHAGGRLWELRQMGAAPLIDVSVPHFSNTLRHPLVRLRRTNVLEPVDVVERPDGIRVASPPRLLFDLARSLDDIALESVIEQVLQRRWCTVPTLYDTARRLCHPARPGSSRFARVLGSRPAWLKPVDSHLELLLYDSLRAAGLPGMERQVRIEVPGGYAIHADIAVPAWKWAIAIDHVTWHGGRVDAQRDKENDRRARMIGWQVDRVTDDDIEQRLLRVTGELLVIADQMAASASVRIGVGGAARGSRITGGLGGA